MSMRNRTDIEEFFIRIAHLEYEAVADILLRDGGANYFRRSDTFDRTARYVATAIRVVWRSVKTGFTSAAFYRTGDVINHVTHAELPEACTCELRTDPLVCFYSRIVSGLATQNYIYTVSQKRDLYSSVHNSSKY